MAKKRSGSSFLLLLIFFLLIGGAAGYFFFFTDILSTPSSNPPVVTNQPENEEKEILANIDTWVPEVVWEEQQTASKQVYYGLVKGKERTGTLVDKDGHLDRFEDVELMKKNGLSEDLNLATDTQTGSLWGYGKNIEDQMQIVVISYENKDAHPNEQGVLEANCPCTLTLSVFVSDTFKPNWKE